MHLARKENLSGAGEFPNILFSHRPPQLLSKVVTLAVEKIGISVLINRMKPCTYKSMSHLRRATT